MASITEDTTSAPTAAGQVELAIGGMTCASCAAPSAKRPHKIEGVEATVNYATEKAKVVFPVAVSPDELVAAVEGAGYTATLPRPEPAVGEGTPEPEGTAPDALTVLRTRLFVSVALAVPVIALAMIPGLQFTNWQWASLTLAAPVVVYGGLPFHRAAWANL